MTCDQSVMCDFPACKFLLSFFLTGTVQFLIHPHIYFYYLRGSVWISIMTSVSNVRHRGQPETAMTSSLLHATKSNQVSYIDVEVDSNDSLSVREGWKEGGDSEPEGDGRCKHCGRTLLKMAGVALSGVVFGIAMEKSRGNSAQNDHIFITGFC